MAAADQLVECHSMWSTMFAFAREADGEQRTMAQQVMHDIMTVATEVTHIRLAVIRTQAIATAVPEPAPLQSEPQPAAPQVVPVPLVEDKYPFLAKARAAFVNPRQWVSDEWADTVDYFESIGYWFPLLSGMPYKDCLGVVAARRKHAQAMQLMGRKPNDKGQYRVRDIRGSGLDPIGVLPRSFADYEDHECCPCCGGVPGEQPAFKLTDVFRTSTYGISPQYTDSIKEATLAAWAAAIPRKSADGLYSRWEIETHIAPLVRVIQDTVHIEPPVNISLMQKRPGTDVNTMSALPIGPHKMGRTRSWAQAVVSAAEHGDLEPRPPEVADRIGARAESNIYRTAGRERLAPPATTQDLAQEISYDRGVVTQLAAHTIVRREVMPIQVHDPSALGGCFALPSSASDEAAAHTQ